MIFILTKVVMGSWWTSILIGHFKTSIQQAKTFFNSSFSDVLLNRAWPVSGLSTILGLVMNRLCLEISPPAVHINPTPSPKWFDAGDQVKFSFFFHFGEVSLLVFKSRFPQAKGKNIAFVWKKICERVLNWVTYSAIAPFSVRYPLFTTCDVPFPYFSILSVFIYLGPFCVCNFSYLEIVDVLFIG